MQPLTSPPQRRPKSLLHYAPAFVILAIAIADASRFADTDLWGHVAFGRLFLQVGPVSHDPFNYSAPGHLWKVHEWLSEVLMALAYNTADVAGLKLLKLLCSAITVVMLAAAEAETGAPIPIQFGVLMVSAFALMPQMQFRPQTFSFALMATLMAMLARENYGRRVRLWIAVPMFALWANLHGGVFIGIAALCVYSAVVTAVDLFSGRTIRRGMRLFAVAIASTAATLLTPYGTAIWTAVIDELRNPLTRVVVVDWRPLLTVIGAQLHTPHSGIAFTLAVVGIIATLAISVAASPRDRDWPLVAVAALMSLTAFVAVRNMAFAVIACAVPLTRHLARLTPSQWKRAAATGPLSSNSPPSPVPTAPPGHFFVRGQIVVVLMALLIAVESGLFSGRIEAASAYPAGAVAFMRTHRLRGNIFTTFEWGEYMIWNAAPASKVFIDARFDLVYPIPIIRQYLDFINGVPGSARVLDRYPHDYVLMPTQSFPYQTLMARPDWKLIYRDSVAALFARTNSPAAHIPGVPVRGTAPPSVFP